jgi:hypothetical protein
LAAQWAKIEPRRYERQVQAPALIQVMLMALVCYAPGLRATARHGAALLRTLYASTLSYALRRPSTLALIRAMVGQLSGCLPWSADALVALDGMAITFYDSLPHGCARFAPGVAGGGVIWGLQVAGRRRGAPLRILRVLAGPWSDSRQMISLCLQPGGPVYLMDRGFWSLALIQGWMEQGVRFIVRATRAQLRWEAKRRCGRARRAGQVWIEHDVIAQLGAATARHRPVARLVCARLDNGKDLILISERLDWSAERLLAAYRLRWRIENFHKWIKQVAGLAHLYSLQQRGIEVLLYLTVLLGLLIWHWRNSNGCVENLEAALWAGLRELRESLGLMERWRPNVPHHPRTIKQSKRIAGLKGRRRSKNH